MSASSIGRRRTQDLLLLSAAVRGWFAPLGNTVKAVLFRFLCLKRNRFHRGGCERRDEWGFRLALDTRHDSASTGSFRQQRRVSLLGMAPRGGRDLTPR